MPTDAPPLVIRHRRGRCALSTAVAAVIAFASIGCSVDPPPPEPPPSDPGSFDAAPASSTTSTPSGIATETATGTKDGSKDGTRDETASTTGDTDVSAVDPAEQVEVPVAAEPAVDSLSELLQPVDIGPLVSAPLPRSARARGRLVPAFPAPLRPTRATSVQSSSISASGDRLQIALVATTSLAPGQVLLAYRTRLARRGVVEQATPLAMPGSQAAAFRRGRSVITVTVTGQGYRTSYSVTASLHTGGA